uniref:C3H1-type domain-containing protein n=1 Tax=Zooxanthella nutricula TaxID=1333877 RepID=A0A7S2QJ31_9DINO
MKDGDVRSRELCDVVGALARSKYFDPGLFELLASELQRACRKGRLGAAEILQVLCSMSELNAYNAALFGAACEALRPGLKDFSEALRSRLEAALKRVNHDPGSDFFNCLQQRPRDTREACPMFWRGQCKWGPKCKLSHDQDSFEATAREGNWRPPSQSGGRSVGFNQSSDLFKADRCGALW